MIQAIDQIMKDSVKHHLIADVEVGSFLSSGIDSSYPVSYTHLFLVNLIHNGDNIFHYYSLHDHILGTFSL